MPGPILHAIGVRVKALSTTPGRRITRRWDAPGRGRLARGAGLPPPARRMPGPPESRSL